MARRESLASGPPLRGSAKPLTQGHDSSKCNMSKSRRLAVLTSLYPFADRTALWLFVQSVWLCAHPLMWCGTTGLTRIENQAHWLYLLCRAMHTVASVNISHQSVTYLLPNQIAEHLSDWFGVTVDREDIRWCFRLWHTQSSSFYGHRGSRL